MSGREGEIPSSVSTGSGGGGRQSGAQAEAVEDLQAAQGLRDAFGFALDRSNTRFEQFLENYSSSRKSGPAPDFTTSGVNSRIDPWLSTGGGQDEAQFYYRKLALTDPTAYEEARTAALNAIKESIKTTFDTTLSQYQSAGYSIQDAEVKALEAAKASREIQMKALATKFGMNDSLYMEGAHKGAAAFKLGR